MELHEKIELVDDQNSFLAFVESLILDREESVKSEQTNPGNPSNPYSQEANGWENGTIESFLGAAHAWAIASNFGASQDLGQANIWKKMAIFLYCGKIYE